MMEAKITVLSTKQKKKTMTVWKIQIKKNLDC